MQRGDCASQGLAEGDAVSGPVGSVQCGGS